MTPADHRKTRTIDVRPLIARGEEPFQKLMAAIASLAPDENLVVITPFLPSPLIERLQGAGFEARPERRTDGSWQTFFWRE